MYQKEWLYDKLFTNIYDLRSGVSSGKRLCLSYLNSSVLPGSSGAQNNAWWQCRFKEIVRFLLENWSFLRRRVTAKLHCEIWWLTTTLTLVPFLFEAAQFKDRMRFRVIIHHERVSQCTGLGSGWVSIIGTSVFQSWILLRMAEEPRRKVAEKRGGRVQWSLKVLLSVRWHLRAWPTGTTCHSPTCYYPYKSNRGPGSRWQIKAATSWQQPAGGTHPRGSQKPSNEKILYFCGCVTQCPLKSCHLLKKRFIHRPCYLVIIL